MFYLIDKQGRIVSSAQSVADLRRNYPRGEYTVAQASGILREGEYIQRISNMYSYYGKKSELG